MPKNILQDIVKIKKVAKEKEQEREIKTRPNENQKRENCDELRIYF